MRNHDSYVPQVYALLQREASAEEIAAHLDAIATERMGLTSKMGHHRVVAQTLLDWRAMLLQERPETLG